MPARRARYRSEAGRTATSISRVLRVLSDMQSLERDGLARVTPPTGSTDYHPAVAEERASYTAGTQDSDQTGVRVSLP